MRATCLQCGHQIDLAPSKISPPAAAEPVICPLCHSSYGSWPQIDAQVVPDVKAAEALRARAFHAAGLVTDWGQNAWTLVMWGILFFPLALIGALLGAYAAMLPPPEGRYSGSQTGRWALLVGLIIFCSEGWGLWLLFGAG